MAWKDAFGRVAGSYRLYRPGYPKELVATIVSCCEERRRGEDPRLAVDIATGSGQLGFELARTGAFEKLICQDRSEDQIVQAREKWAPEQ
eukprot:gene15588-23792_t